MVHGFDHCLFGAFREFDAFDPVVQQHIYASPASLPRAAELIAGHLALSTVRQAYPRAQSLTILREPVSRLLSHWIFWRQHTDAELTPWGAWADRVRYARQPLATFLREPLLACQTDNLALRMLLWPHPLVPPDRFIDPNDDDRLVAKALAQLRDFDFVEVIENDDFVRNLQLWLGRPVTYDRLNETGPLPANFRAPLHPQLTAEAHDLLVARSRLDLRLWAEIAANRLHDHDVSRRRERSLMVNIARYSVLLAP
jgi:hypothetical protein